MIEKINDNLKKYDFKSNVLLHPEELKIVKILIEKFSEMLSFSITNNIKKFLNITYKETLINKFNQLLKDIEFPIVKCDININGISTNMFIKLDNKIIILLIDSFLGGDLKNLSNNTLTKFEEKLVINIIQRFISIFEKVITKNINIVLKVKELIKKIDDIELTTTDELVSSIKISIELEKNYGDLIIIMPVFVLEQILKSNTKKNIEKVKNNNIEKIIYKLKDIYIDCNVVLEIEKIKLKDILNIKVGDCIVFNYNINSSVIIKLENIPKFLGMPGKIDKKFAVKIVDYYNRKEVKNG